MSSLIRSVLVKLCANKNVYSTQTCRYGRWTHKRPQRVLTTEFNSNNNESVNDSVVELNPRETLTKNVLNKPIKIINVDELEEKTNYVDYNVKPIPQTKTNYKKPMQNKVRTVDMLETVIDADGNFIYTKLKDNDPVIGKLMVTVKSRKENVKKDIALLEGKRLIRDALQSGCKLQTVLFSRKADIEFLKPLLPRFGSTIYKMPYRDIQMWSNLTTSPGIMGIFKTPKVDKYEPPENSLPITIICDNVREPGNLGAILRSSAAVGCRKVILTNGCVDLWDTKVLRSASGAHFHVQIHCKQDIEQIPATLLDDEYKLFIADNNVVSSASAGQLSVDLGKDVTTTLEEVVKKIPVVPYYSVNYKTIKSIVIIVGGETNGISEETYRLAADVQGVRINVPLSNCVESLNTGTALGVIAFEIKRQLSMEVC